MAETTDLCAKTGVFPSRSSGTPLASSPAEVRMFDAVAGASAWVGTVADLMDVGRVLILALTMVGVVRVGVGYGPVSLRRDAPERCRRCRRRLRGKC